VKEKGGASESGEGFVSLEGKRLVPRCSKVENCGEQGPRVVGRKTLRPFCGRGRLRRNSGIFSSGFTDRRPAPGMGVQLDSGVEKEPTTEGERGTRTDKIENIAICAFEKKPLFLKREASFKRKQLQ